MADSDNKEPTFPEGYEHVEERLNKTEDLLEELDKQIENAPHDPGPAPTLKPIGTTLDRRTGYRERKIAFLKDQKDRIKDDAWGKIEADTRDGDKVADRQVRDDARERLFPNPFRKMTDEERALKRNEERTLDVSQDYLDAERLANTTRRNVVPQKDKSTPSKPGKTEKSMSQRYSERLKFERFVKEGREMVSTIKLPEPDRD